jgi:hypothetical protein
MKTYGGVEVQLHKFLILAQTEVGGQLYTPATLPPRERAPLQYPLD